MDILLSLLALYEVNLMCLYNLYKCYDISAELGLGLGLKYTFFFYNNRQLFLADLIKIFNVLLVVLLSEN